MHLFIPIALLLNLVVQVHSTVMPKVEKIYDFVVVGSGIGGGTLAVELARKNFTVLLIESGPDYETEKIRVPFTHVLASGEPEISWDFRVKYYDTGKGSDRLFHYPRVGGLGGCSTHNVMISVLPNTRDYELMAELTGDDSWKEKAMRNYFKRFEKNLYTDPRLNKDHGYAGWFPISYTDPVRLNDTDPKSAQLFPSIVGNFSVDINGYDSNGNLSTDSENKVFIPMAVDNTNYERVDFRGRIKQTQKDFPLEVWTDTHVTKVLLDKVNRAYGVEFVQGRHLYKSSPLSNPNLNYNWLPKRQVFVKREVIVSGGAFNTPQILMLSGIGDSEKLAKLNIPTKVHLPGVGQSLMDKHETAVSFQLKEDFTLTKDCTYTLDKEDPCYVQYRTNRSGPYISNAILTGELKKSSPNLTEPNLFILNVPANFTGYEPGFVQNIMRPKNFFSRVIFQVHTKSKGTVELQTNSPLDPPQINFKKFTDGILPNSEIDVLLQAVKTNFQFLQSLPLDTTPVYPTSLNSDVELRDMIRSNMFGHHICCTAKIGTDKDRLAVLDSKFKVRNTSNLRVVDASAFNLPPGYFPSIFTHLMATKVADLIEKEYRKF